VLATLDKQFNTIAGSYVTEEQEIYLIAEDDKVQEAVIDLIRIGLDNIIGYVTPAEVEAYDELVSTETIDFSGVDTLMNTGDYQILDVRKKTEFVEGHHPQAINIAHTRLLDRIGDVPANKPVLVHCKSGNRASFATSLLERKGFEVKFIDDAVEPWLEKNKYAAEV
jgi:hydroxyacylglutathione hydrolase